MFASGRPLRVLACLVLCFDLSRAAWNTRVLDEFVEALIACRDVPAATIAVVQLDDHDNVAHSYTKGYGFQDPTCQKSACPKVDETTRFCIGSCSKAFTGSLLGSVLQNSSQYKTTLWDTPVAQLLPVPQANFFGGDVISTKVTVRDILAHRMGIYRSDFVWAMDPGLSRQEMLSNVYTLNALGPLEQVWRSSFYYNNLLVAFAGHIAETLTGWTWEDLIERYYFEALNMTDSGFYHVDYEHGTNFARMGTRMNGTWTKDPRPAGFSRYMIAPAAAGAICSNAVDMTKYLEFLLRENATVDDHIAREILAEAMTASNVGGTPAMSKPSNPIGSSQDTYGFGWWQGQYRGYNRVEHDGGIDGFVTNIILLPTVKLGIFVSTATDLVALDPAAIQISYYIADQILGLDPWLQLSSICNASGNSTSVEGTPPGSPNCMLRTSLHEQFVGIYAHPLYGTAHVTLDEGAGELKLAYGTYGRANLCRWPEADDNPNVFFLVFSDDLFYIAGNTPSDIYSGNLTVTFQMDNDDNVHSLVFTAISPLGYPKFQKLASSTAVPKSAATKRATTQWIVMTIIGLLSYTGLKTVILLK